ncbi:alpha/beta hydrolase [Micromonospora sp. NPDC049559]|uniref:alpha/beta fold hydrolase n=1 Tax=Micromonospora sp. NPDC049559 TaxID=3155923 RepID=UPI00343DF335
MPKIAINQDVVLGYQTYGNESDESLLLICPSAQNRLVFHSLAEVLAKNGYHVVTYDNRGTGESDRGSASISTAQLAADAVGVLDALSIDRAHVLGWSIGSAAAQELAIGHPERVAALVLYATWAHVDTFQRAIFTALRHTWNTRDMDEILAAMAIVFSPELIDSPAFADLVADILPTLPSTEAAITTTIEQFEADLAHDTRGRLHLITSPTLVVAGEQDLLTPVWQARYVAEAIPLAEVKILSGLGSSHALAFERSAEFISLVLEFLQRHALGVLPGKVG